jgi:universal stress protein E
MSYATILPDHRIASPARRAAIGPSSPFPVLAAVTGDDMATSTFAVARALATRRGATPNLINVIETDPYVGAEAMSSFAILADQLMDREYRAERERELRHDLGLDHGVASSWPVEIDVGNTATCIARRAHRVGAQLILLGMHHHRALGRVLGADTVHDVVTLADVPVLAVRPSLTGLPRRVVVAVDFSASSVRAAHFARRIMDDTGTIYLVFVDSRRPTSGSRRNEGARWIEDRGIGAAFSELTSQIGAPATMKVVPVLASGSDVVYELKRVCDEITPDLVVVARQRHTPMERLIFGSVTRGLLKHGEWSILAMPASG